MTLLRTLGLVLYSAFLFTTLSSNSQTATTNNLINNSNWTGIGAYAPDPNNCCSNPAGSQPLYDTTTNTIKFSYGQATVQQSIAVNQALANAGTGIQVSGYSWGYDLRNMNGHGGPGVDTLTVNTWLRNTAGQNVAGTSTVYNTLFDWTSFSGTQTLPNTVLPSTLSTVGISFTGRDTNFWAGLYGPEVRNVSLKLNYGVDPCATNPAYSPSCAGFNTVVLSNNLVPNPNGYAYGGSTINNSYAINTALASAGSGAMVHGFQWGYVANANGPYCGSWDMGIFGCWDFRDPSVTTNVNITSASGASLYNVSREYKNSYNTTNYSYLFPSSQQMSTLGNFNFTASTNDQAYIGSMWSRAVYTVDPCVSNVFSSPSCPGYQEALNKLIPPVPTQTTTQTATSTGVTTTVDTVTVSPTSTYVAPAPQVETQTATQTTTQTTSPTGSPAPAGSPSQQTVAQSAPAATQTKAGEVSDSSGSSKTTVSLSSVLSMIGSNQEKTTALEKSVVQAADAQAFSAGETAKQNAEKVAGDAQSQSITASNSQSAGGAQASSTQSFSGPGQNSGVALQGNLQSNTMFNAARLEQSLASVNSEQSSSSSNITVTTQQSSQIDNRQEIVFNAPQIVAYVPRTDSTPKVDNTSIPLPKYEPPVTNDTMGMQIPIQTIIKSTGEFKQDTSTINQFTIAPPVKYEQPKIDTIVTTQNQFIQYQPPVIKQDLIVSAISPQLANYNLMPPSKPIQAQIEMPAMEGIKFGGNKTPVESAIETRPIILQTTTGQQTDTVKKNVQNNELAGGVNIESMAKQPANYAQYFSMIPDAAFYAPKEIYKNQKTVDNARVLRGLTGGSDALHQRMVEEQYKLGN